MGQVLAEIPGIPTGTRAPSVRGARRLLDGSYKSVDDLLNVAKTLSDQRRAANSSPRGRQSQNEVDLLRSAIVFASAGLDASMKRLVNDAGRVLVGHPATGARKQYEEFIKLELAQPKVADGFRDSLLKPDIVASLLTHYLSQKSKASFQGTSDLEARVVNLLGLPGKTLTKKRIGELDDFFIARNSIVHAMDYEIENSTTRARKTRALADVTTLSFTALATAADLINATATVLGKGRLR